MAEVRILLQSASGVPVAEGVLDADTVARVAGAPNQEAHVLLDVWPNAEHLTGLDRFIVRLVRG